MLDLNISTVLGLMLKSLLYSEHHSELSKQRLADQNLSSGLFDPGIPITQQNRDKIRSVPHHAGVKMSEF